ncbi:MAG: hypothetical protein NTW95_11110 [Candidatus Aminicenantes bacterium]|nr:hypothetical protein [Candidatus Aminicenantes bacterium]
MTKKSRPGIGAQVAFKAVVAEASAMAFIYFFTKSAVYCIISLTGAAISIAAFALLIRSTDRILKKGKGRMMFFLLAQLKLLIIAVAFYALSRWTKSGAVFFIQGIAIIYLAILIEGLARFSGNASHGT